MANRNTTNNNIEELIASSVFVCKLLNELNLNNIVSNDTNSISIILIWNKLFMDSIKSFGVIISKKINVINTMK